MASLTSGSGAASEAKGKARSAGNQVRNKVPDTVLEALGKVGIAAMGVVHLLLAWVTVQIVFGGSGQSADNTGALKELAGNGFGKFALALLVVGFAAYAVAQGFAAAIGHRKESGKKRVVKRVSSGAKAAIAVSLAITCVRLLAGSGATDSSDKQAGWTAKLMEQPAGRWLVALVGLAVIGWAGYEIYKGWEKKFLKHIEGHPGHTFELLGRIGYIARGAVFGILGVLLVVAAIQEDPSEAQGLDGALKTLAEAPFGSVLLVLMALGLAAFGAFQLFTAPKYQTD